MSDRLETRRGAASVREAPRAAAVNPADLAWLLIVPAVAVAIPAIALLAPLGGRLLLPDPGYHYWPDTEIVRKPAVHVGYLMCGVAALLYVAAIVRLARERMRPSIARALVVAVQAAAAAFVVACWIAQRHLSEKPTRLYFSTATLLLAAAATAATALVVRLRRDGKLDGGRVVAWLRALDTRATQRVCLAAAALVTVLWLLPGVHTDRATPLGPAYLDALFFDEATAVLNGRLPLVDMVAYGTLWPYLTALPLAAFDGSYAAFSIAMAALAGCALLAVYGVLRRVAGSALLALALYVPVLATGFFIGERIGVDRYDPGTYYGMFPLRYAGPYLLAWLTVWHLQRADAGRWSRRLLFAAAGLVALNNLDFGLSALAATVTMLVVVRPARSRAALAALATDLGVGLAAALVLVSALTLAGGGSLPQLGLLLRYGRVFVVGGAENRPLPGLGLHLVVSATFLAAAAVAAVRAIRVREGDVLAGALAWCAVFGFGASVYYYAYRSRPDVLVNLFSIWSLTVALLVLAAMRGTPSGRRWPSVPALAVAFAFFLAVCSIAQAPSPVGELRRIAAPAADGQVNLFLRDFRQARVTRIVAAQTRPGERVAILSQVGHRIARDAGVVNVSPYAGLEQMPAREQLEEVVRILRREHGDKVFVAQADHPGVHEALVAFGFPLVGQQVVETVPNVTVSEYRAG
ncbi:MAG TPA: hypothetical protein VFG31_04555 [Conexibacter sp.]|nr:hypothetical protein [Conexibacter sp.]